VTWLKWKPERYTGNRKRENLLFLNKDNHGIALLDIFLLTFLRNGLNLTVLTKPTA